MIWLLITRTPITESPFKTRGRQGDIIPCVHVHHYFTRWIALLEKCAGTAWYPLVTNSMLPSLGLLYHYHTFLLPLNVCDSQDCHFTLFPCAVDYYNKKSIDSCAWRRRNSFSRVSCTPVHVYSIVLNTLSYVVLQLWSPWIKMIKG